ncbi:MAG: hypothetical protein R3337_00020 [Gammaproteobacteria bacterium]|nr:hypothetical protein [Gammaproteobacteria bacterium]
MAETVVYDNRSTPKCTLTKDGEQFTAVLEVVGLAPTRDVSIEESTIGVLSLDPPTVRAYSHRELIDAAQRAVQAAVSSTMGSRGTAAEIAFVYLRTATAVRNALRMLDEDI